MSLSRHLTRVSIAALCGLLVAADAHAQIGRVNGVVKDDGGQPLKGVTITAENTNIGQSFTATTDERGRFQILGMRNGQWRFIAQAPGFSPQAGDVPIRMGSPNPPLTFVLQHNGVAAFGALGGISSKDLQTDLASADALFAKARWDEAIEAYRSIMAKSPALSIVNLQIAAAYRGKKDYANALSSYEALLKADPDNVKAHLGIAETDIDKGDPRAAEEHLLKAAESASAGREVFFQLGEVRLTQNDTKGAIAWYRKASAADPFWGKPVYKLGLCAMKDGDTSAAATLLQRVIAIDPGSAEAAQATSTLASLKK